MNIWPTWWSPSSHLIWGSCIVVPFWFYHVTINSGWEKKVSQNIISKARRKQKISQWCKTLHSNMLMPNLQFYVPIQWCHAFGVKEKNNLQNKKQQQPQVSSLRWTDTWIWEKSAVLMWFKVINVQRSFLFCCLQIPWAVFIKCFCTNEDIYVYLTYNVSSALEEVVPGCIIIEPSTDTNKYCFKYMVSLQLFFFLF